MGNILSMYSSTSFDKNFKTFYKGDPYNFEIDMNFKKDHNKGLNKIDEEKERRQTYNINPVKKSKPDYNFSIQHPQFTVSDRTPPKVKKRSHVSHAPMKNSSLSG